MLDKFGNTLPAIVIVKFLISSTLSLSGLDSLAKCHSFKTNKPVTEAANVYESTLFSEGEEQYYELFYMGVFVGFGKLEVKKPVKHANQWHSVFAAAAHTAPSYEFVFQAEERMMTYSLPNTFQVSRFKLEQDEKRVGKTRFQSQKWLKFDHSKCYVKEIILEKGKKQKVKRFDLASGATDILSSFYQVRQLDFKIGKMERLLIYTSEKSWWAEATPIKKEIVEVPAGKFEAYKISMKTFVGKVAEQAGDMFLWVAVKGPSRPLVKVEGEVKIGSISLELARFTPGVRQRKPKPKK